MTGDQGLAFICTSQGLTFQEEAKLKSTGQILMYKLSKFAQLEPQRTPNMMPLSPKLMLFHTFLLLFPTDQ